MDLWPTSTGSYDSISGKSKGKGKNKSEVQRTYPVVEYGAVGAANLYRAGERLDWAFVQGSSGRRLISRGNAVKIYPACRSELPTVSRTTSLQRTDQGAHFLRTVYPDIDIASDLIREELTEEARLSAELQNFDPYVGNVLTSFSCSERTRRRSAYLAFPSGATGCELNISPFSYSSNEQLVFKPSAKAARTFDTPIQQLVSFTSGNPLHTHSAFIAIRTLGTTKLLGIRNNSSGMTTEELATISRLDIGDKQPVDMVFSESVNMQQPSLIVVNDQGDVYKCTPEGEKELLYRQSSRNLTDKFWRVADSREDRTSLLLSSDTLSLLDFRMENHGITLHSNSHQEVFTSMETPDCDRMIRLVSTGEILWIDKRYPHKPILGVKHNRQADRSLQLQTMTFDNCPLTFLRSSRNALVTVYDVSAGNDGFVHSNVLPYSLPPVEIIGSRPIGHSLVRHSSELSGNNAIMLLLSDRGSLHRTDLRFSEEGRDQNSDTEPQMYEWPAEVRQLAVDMEGSRWPPGPLSGRAFSEVDMEPVYQRLFNLDKQDQSSGQADDVYEIIDSMHSFWQNLDVPVEHVLTTFDVAFRAGEEPNGASRADFFTKSVLNSKRGCRALMQGRIPTEHISKQAPWHYNLTPSLRRLVPAISDSPGETIQNLRRYDLQSDDYRPGASISKEIEAREHLALDLALSKDVYSPHAIQLIDPDATLDEAFETMSRATEAMSIGIPEPPSVQFGFLRPVSGRGADHYGKVKDGGEDGINCPLGVRLLLKEWEVGSDPQTYTHQDPYDSSGPTAAVSRGINKATTEGSTELKSQSQPQRAPPVIVAAPMAPPAIVSTQLRPPLLAQSQDPRITPIANIGSQPAQFGASQDPSSQEIFMSSTQILPGPYGGRLVPAKKKPAKKRLGGF